MAHPAELTFRYAAPEDAPAVAGLHADSWQRHYRGAYSDQFLDGDVTADRLTVWTERLHADGATTATIVAEVARALIGFVHVIFDDDREWGSLVDNLHVFHGRKRSGIGTALMREAARSVVEYGPGGLHLWVLEQNVEAQAFYRARGGIPSGRRLVRGPGGVASRLNGSPAALRFAWSDPRVLLTWAT